MSIHNDVRLAWRSLWLRAQRAYALATTLSFALGIGAAAAIFSITWAMLLAPLPYHAPERVVRLTEQNLKKQLPEFAVSTPNFLSWVDRTRSFEALAGMRFENVNLGDGRGGFERVEGGSVSPALWQVLGQPLVAGRTFTAEEDRVNGPAVVILGAQVWRDRFGADPALLGRTVLINGTAHTVVGIAPQDAGFSNQTAVWLPLRPDPQTYGRGDRRLSVLARLRNGVDLAAARAELQALSATLAQEFPAENTDWQGALEPAHDWIVGDDARSRVLLLLGAVLLLMLLACCNVANLQIARNAGRRRELGVREVLGAGQARLWRQIAVENLLLACLGGLLGAALAWLVVQFATVALPAGTPRLHLFGLHAGAVALAFVAATATTLLFGLLPMVLGRRQPLAGVLRAQGRSNQDEGRGWLRRALVVAQFSLATLLVVAATTLALAFHRLQQTPPGFSPERLLTARLTLPQSGENMDLGPHYAVYARLLEALRGLPGVQTVGMSSEIPLGSFDTSMMVAAGAGTGPLSYTQDARSAAWRVISADYLQALGVPLLRGRWLAGDQEGSRNLLISRSLASQLWPEGTDAVGQTVRLSNGQQRTVVGVVGDVHQRSLADGATPTMYMPTAWMVTPTMNLVLRTEGDPSALIAPVRELARQMFPDFPLFDLSTMPQVLAGSVAEPRLQAMVLLGFAGASLLLAAFGVAGVMAWLVSRRTPELAVRMALGAPPRRLLRQVVRSAAMLCLVGIALGAGALLTLVQGGLLGGVIPSADLYLTLAGGAGLLLAVGWLACWLPARRVTRISPNLAMREG